MRTASLGERLASRDISAVVIVGALSSSMTGGWLASSIKNPHALRADISTRQFVANVARARVVKKYSGVKRQNNRKRVNSNALVARERHLRQIYKTEARGGFARRYELASKIEKTHYLSQNATK
jgi:hypothetical protein